jgi:hypothetical protein
MKITRRKLLAMLGLAPAAAALPTPDPVPAPKPITFAGVDLASGCDETWHFYVTYTPPAGCPKFAGVNVVVVPWTPGPLSLDLPESERIRPKKRRRKRYRRIRNG